jgi:Tfp pilus assembly protein PilN
MRAADSSEISANVYRIGRGLDRQNQDSTRLKFIIMMMMLMVVTVVIVALTVMMIITVAEETGKLLEKKCL